MDHPPHLPFPLPRLYLSNPRTPHTHTHTPQTSQTECEADLREQGIPCVWRTATAACEYGLPHGNVTHYAVGGRHSVFRLLDGSVWTAGNNDFGQLGHSCLGAAGCSASETFQEVLFENRDLFGTCVETVPPPVGGGGGGEPECLRVSGAVLRAANLLSADYVAAVFAGEEHSAAKTVSGRLFTWGSNHKGQLGIAAEHLSMVSVPHVVDVPQRPALETITCVAAGAQHMVAVSDIGKVYVWGSNSHGQLGHAASFRNESRVPVMVQNAVLAWGVDVPVSVSAGGAHTIVGTLAGKVYTFGRNNYGQLGREGFDDVVPRLAFGTRPPKVFHGAAPTWGCQAAQKYNDAWPAGTDFTLGRVEPSVYQRR